MGVQPKVSFVKHIILIMLGLFFVVGTLENTYLFTKITVFSSLRYLSPLTAMVASGLALSCLDLTSPTTRLGILLLLIAGLFLPGHRFAYLILIYTIPIIGWRHFFSLNLICTSLTTLCIVLLLSPWGSHNVYNPVMGHWKLSLGFNNPNTLGLICLIILLETLLLKYYLNPYRFWGLVATFSLLLGLSDSRTAILCYLIFLIFQFCQIGVRLLHLSIIKGFAATMPFVNLIISLIFTYWLKLAHGHLITGFDQEMSNRWRQAVKFINYHGFSVLGQSLNVSSHNALDSGYIYLLLSCGILATIIFLALLAITIYRLLEHQYFQLVIPLLIMCLYGLSEGSFFSLHSNPFLVLLAILILNKDQLNEKI